MEPSSVYYTEKDGGLAKLSIRVYSSIFHNSPRGNQCISTMFRMVSILYFINISYFRLSDNILLLPRRKGVMQF